MKRKDTSLVGGKKTIGLLFGGRSSEHEVSLRSAFSIYGALDKTRFEVVSIGIDPRGRWYVDQIPPKIEPNPDQEVAPVLYPGDERSRLVFTTDPSRSVEVDVFFPALHGPLYEDGALQGVLELSDASFVGAGVLASAIGMHKDMAKKILAYHGIPVVPAVSAHRSSWSSSQDRILSEIDKTLSYPVFVKPNNMGSSVGVQKAQNREQVMQAVENALLFDEKVLIEKAISAREVELSVLQNRDPHGGPLVSVPGEVIPTHEFYSYEAKYQDEKGADLVVPASLKNNLREKLQETAARAFEVIECEGMARVDFFVDKKTSEFYVNELNTLPGFTEISMYPKLWEASGLHYTDLLSHLIELAIDRARDKKKLKRLRL